MNANRRTIILKPHPLGWLYAFVLCGLAIPLLGLGLIAGFFLLRHIRSMSYHLDDDQVELRIGERSTVVRWTDVVEVTAESRAGRLGHLVLRTAEARYRLLFLENAFSLADTIRTLLEARRSQPEEVFVPREAEIPMGNERLNDLTALWQQGLISEEDYQAERKHFT